MAEADIRAPTLRGVEKALEMIRPHMPETPLLRSDVLSDAFGCDLWLKNEGAAPTFSFKLRGATNEILHAPRRKLGGVVVASSGNLGLAVAWLARAIGVPAHVFLSDAVSQKKARLIEIHGGTVHRGGAEYDDAYAAAVAFARERDFHLVDDGASVDIVEGGGTTALEVARRLPDIDYVILPLGGGSHSAGASFVMKSVDPRTRTVAVQPEAAPVMARSFHERRALVIPPRRNVADGLTQRGTAPYVLDLLWRHLDDAWLVDDRDILAAVHTLLESAHVLTEPSGAAAFAGAWTHREALRGKRVVVVLTGANATVEQLQAALATEPFVSLGA
ncbi:MAG: pyridoxal-phosphate dependent enzyme [Alphaproteobacteria bacterium]